MMFVSKEQENLMRARNIKRLSFVLYSGEVDLYQSHLSWIQEKLVEALKLPDAYPVYVEVFHCLRILMLRISPRRLVSFWPVIFTELVHGISRSLALSLSLSAYAYQATLVQTDAHLWLPQQDADTSAIVVGCVQVPRRGALGIS